MSAAALGFCLALHRLQGDISRRADEDLGSFHGLNFGDFALLRALTESADGRMALADLATALGLPMSALVRKLVQLEKIGLTERVAGPEADPRRHAAIRSGGRQVMQHAVATAEAACAKAVRTLDPIRLSELQATLAALSACEAPRA